MLNWNLPVRLWSRRKSVLAMVVAFVVVTLVPMLPTLTALALASARGEADPSALLNSSGAWFEVLKFSLFTLFAVLTTGVIRRGWAHRSDFGLFAPDTRRTVIATVVGFLTYFVVVQVFTRLMPGAPEASQQVGKSLGLGQSAGRDALVVLTVAVATPIGEEFLFRGLLFRTLRDGLSNLLPKFAGQAASVLLVAVLLSAFAFMQSHGGDGQDLQIYIIGLMGVIAALAYTWSGSLLSGIMIHGINNAYAIYVTGKGSFVNPDLSLGLALLSPLLVLSIVYGITAVLKKDEHPA